MGSRRIFKRLQTYIIYRMASSLLILFFFFFSIIAMDFDFPTWVLVLTSIQNDLSVMTTSFDNVYSSEYPEIWNMTKCLTVAFFIAVAGALGSLISVYTVSRRSLESVRNALSRNAAGPELLQAIEIGAFHLRLRQLVERLRVRAR